MIAALLAALSLFGASHSDHAQHRINEARYLAAGCFHVAYRQYVCPLPLRHR